jgi:hypothetical protein
VSSYATNTLLHKQPGLTGIVAANDDVDTARKHQLEVLEDAVILHQYFA